MTSRREFLRGAIGSSAFLLLAACSQAPAPAQPPTSPPAPAATTAPAAPAAKPAAPAATSKPAGAGTPPASAASGDRYVVGVGALPKNLDPNSDIALPSMAVFRLLYDNLIKLDENGKPQPGLAESWSLVSPTIWEFKLRKGVTFHNGEDFNAEAVRFSIMDRVINPEAKSGWSSRLNMIEKIDTPDDATVRITTKGPSATLLNNLVLGYILPPKYFKEKGADAFANAPVGTGPMRFKQWQPGDSLEVEASPSYFGGKPGVGAIHFRSLPEEASRMAALQAGELDIAFNVPPEQASLLQQRGFKIVERPIGQTMAVALRTTVPGPLQDKRVRQAMNYAIDKQGIVDALFAGHTRVLDGQAVGPTATGYNPNVKAYPYDPAKAKQLLAEAGYQGEPITLQGAVGRYPKDKETTEAIGQQLEAVGFKVKIDILESTVWNDAFVSGSIGPAFLLGWLVAPSMDVNQAILNMQSSSPRKIAADKTFDDLFSRQASELDPQKREQILMQMAEHVRDEAMMIFLWEVPGIYALSSKVQGVDFRADYSMTLGGGAPR